MDRRFPQIVLFGCGGHARSVADVLLHNDPAVSLVFVDGNAKDDERLYGFEVVRHTELLGRPYFFAVGDNGDRKRRFSEIGTSELVSVISARAHLGHRSTVGKGCFVAHFCHVGPEAEIGCNTIINTSAVVEHEVKVGNHSHVGPRAVISGRSSVGDLVFIGVGAVVKNNVTICSEVVVGAGATVTDDIAEPGIYVGTPARKRP